MQFLIALVLVIAYLVVYQIKTKKIKKFEDVIEINPNRKNINLKINYKMVVGAIFIGLVLFIGATSFYTVDQTEYAVLTTFGRPSADIVGSGLKFKLPVPIQRVYKLSKETYSLTLGYKEYGNNLQVNEMESKMITGDENIILADLEVQWKIVDPIAFLYSTNDPKTILYNATSSSLRNIIGNSTVDDALTDGRTKIINDIRDNLILLADNYNLGISIVNVNLQDVDLPNSEVDAAFKSVTDAREERITKINEANKYRNEIINQVSGQQAAILSKAEGEKITLIEKAKGDVALFNALYSEYKDNQDITSHRLVLQAREIAFKEAQIIIVDDSESTVKYLPIESFIKKGAN